jgi:Uma2 family endonuclease
MLQSPLPRRFTADEFDRMIAIGVLKREEHVELIDGEILLMAARSTHHNASVMRLTTQFGRLSVSQQAILHIHGPIRLSTSDQPELDVALLGPRADFYVHARTTGRDTVLVVEVADPSLRCDRTVKLPLCAAAGIPEAWLAGVGRGRRLEVFREPEGGRYRHHQVLGRDACVAPLAFPDLVIPVREILG